MFDVARIEDAHPLRATFVPRPRLKPEWTRGLPAPVAEAPTREAVLTAA